MMPGGSAWTNASPHKRLCDRDGDRVRRRGAPCPGIAGAGERELNDRMESKKLADLTTCVPLLALAMPAASQVSCVQDHRMTSGMFVVGMADHDRAVRKRRGGLAGSH